MAEDLTHLLRRWHGGEQEALADLLPLVYDELRRLARRTLRGERRDHTLQPTALVHEAFFRLVPQQDKDWQNRAHFFAVCAQLMRQVLVDHARRRGAQKRGGGEMRVGLEQLDGERSSAPPVDLLSLDQALDELTAIDPLRARIVEMRYFAGLSTREIGGVLGRSEWDVKKDWKLAKAWLARRLRETA